METNVSATLQARGVVYGDYMGGSQFRADMMELIRARHLDVHGTGLPPVSDICIYDIVNKLSRLAVTPGHKDTWHDIQGYAKLVEDSLNG